MKWFIGLTSLLVTCLSMAYALTVGVMPWYMAGIISFTFIISSIGIWYSLAKILTDG